MLSPQILLMLTDADTIMVTPMPDQPCKSGTISALGIQGAGDEGNIQSGLQVRSILPLAIQLKILLP
jgi:hypothetical protein